MSIKLSPRLSAAAKMVPVGSSVIDVGTDHGKLPAWLIQNHIAIHAWGSDIHRGPLEAAKHLVETENLQNNMQLRLTDGLQGFSAADGNTVIICGMGGDMIVNILSAAEWIHNGTILILSPHTKPQLCRKWLIENGFSINCEQLVKDNGRIYPIIRAVAGKSMPYTESEFYTGCLKLIDSNPLFSEYLDHLILRLSAAAPYNDNDMAIYRSLQKLKGDVKIMPTVNDIFSLLAEKAPVETKMDFDNVGLLVGRSDHSVKVIMVALDITEDVIDEAIEAGADLIVSHHPLFFSMKTVTDKTWTGSRVLTLAEHKIAAICMHTNLDAAQGGVNDALMGALGAVVDGRLDESTESGRIARIGHMPQAMELPEFLRHVQNSLHGNGLRYHDAGRKVSKISVCGGSGGDEIADAAARGCDTYITADIKYDPFLEAKHLGINLIDADHFCTENVVVPVLRQWINKAFPEVEILISQNHKQTAQFFI